jgi:peptidoglycan/LPS O-acetylase OafA/YrhL
MQPDSANLNVLRTIAVSAVFVSHVIQYCNPNLVLALNLGTIGVLLFFVHTACVLMLSLERQGDVCMWRRFMIRRVMRIYPLSITAVLIYSTWKVATITGFHQLTHPGLSLNSVAANLALVQNLFHLESIPGALWSLPFEIQMYLVLPALYLLTRARKSSDVLTFWLLSVAASLVMMAVGPRCLAEFGQFVPCFMAGVVAYSLPHRPLLPGWLFPVAVIILVALSLLGNPRFLITNWPICFSLGISIPLFRELSQGRVTALAATIAKYSYGVYLFHGLFLSTLLPRFGVIGAIPAAVLTGIVSWLGYHLIEARYIQLGRGLAENNLTNAPTLA